MRTVAFVHDAQFKFSIFNRFLSSFSSKRIFKIFSLQLLSVDNGTVGVGGVAKSGHPFEGGEKVKSDPSTGGTRGDWLIFAAD